MSILAHLDCIPLFRMPFSHISNQSPLTLNPVSHVKVTADPSITPFGNADPFEMSATWHISVGMLDEVHFFDKFLRIYFQ